jgi:hypothetical protein
MFFFLSSLLLAAFFKGRLWAWSLGRLWQVKVWSLGRLWQEKAWSLGSRKSHCNAMRHPTGYLVNLQEFENTVIKFPSNPPWRNRFLALLVRPRRIFQALCAAATRLERPHSCDCHSNSAD